MRNILNNLDLRLETERLILEPINEIHAAEMTSLLAHPDLHTYVPSDPPTLEKLKSRYKYWESRISPEEDELWLNWVGRLKTNGKLVGHFQAGVKTSLDASIAYTIGKDFQRQGLAYEGLAKILELLFETIKSKSVKAWIDTRNLASINLVKKLGMTEVEFIAKADHFKGSDSDEFVFGMMRS
jgi:RimJ/RimL family protein N-acetyltransferase